MAWCVPVWQESVSGEEKEYQEILPRIWVNFTNEIVYWPPKGHKKISGVRNRIKYEPDANWRQFKLLKIKCTGRQQST